MASTIRSMFSGAIPLSVTLIPIKIAKATGQLEGGTRRLCACHQRPFEQKLECPGGSAPRTDAAEARGEAKLVDVVYGVPIGEGDEYAIVDDDDLEQIREIYADSDLTLAGVVRRKDVPSYLGMGTYYVRYADQQRVKADRKSLRTFATLASSLAREGLALIVWWTHHGGPHLGAVYPVNYGGENLMVLQELPPAQAVREPDDKCLAHNDAEMIPREQEIMGALLNELVEDFDHSAYRDEKTDLLVAAVERAEGAALDLPDRPEVPAEAVPDLMAALEASLEAARNGEGILPKPERKKVAGKRVAA